MARNGKDKNKNGLKKLSFWFIFFGSIVFLLISLAVDNLILPTNSTGLWQPLLFAGAIVSSLVLFMMNFGNYGISGHVFASASMKATIAAAFSLTALSAGSNPSLFALTVAGFILSFIGSAAAYAL